MKILFAAAEVAPFSKAGGLSDVVGSLPKALEKDANKFSQTAKGYELMLVPSDSFGFGGYVRISYCVSPEQIENSLPAFKKLIEEYK